MNSTRKLVLDANILLRAVFGKQAHRILKSYERNAEYYLPEHCADEARRNLILIASKKRVEAEKFSVLLEQIISIMIQVEGSDFQAFESEAKARIAARDPNDWPIVATALLVNAPIWTEDLDFFGCGIATWTMDRIEIYLRDA